MDMIKSTPKMITPAKDKPVSNQYHPPVALRAPFFSESHAETMPEGMEGYHIVTVYGYYDVPIMYTIENGEDMYLAYWLGDEKDGKVHVITYLPFSREEQRMVESGEMCLRSMLVSKPAMIVGYDCTKEGWPIDFVRRDVELEKERDILPEAGLDIEIFSVEQKEGKVALSYRLDAGLSFEALVKAASASLCGLWENFFLPHKESGKTLMYGAPYQFYKNWYYTNYSFSSAENKVVPTPNFIVARVASESVITGIEKQAGEYGKMDTSIAIVGEEPVCVSTLSIADKKKATIPYRTSRKIEDVAGEDAKGMAERIGEDAFNAKLVESVMIELKNYHKSLKSALVDDERVYEK